MILGLSFLVFTTAQAAGAPVTVPFTVPAQDLAVQAEVDGKMRTLLLGIFSPGSYVPEPPADQADLRLGGRPFAKLFFSEATVKGPGWDGCLGTDLLRHTAVSFDLLSGEATFWWGGDLPPRDAEDWVRTLPEWGGRPRVRTIPARRLPFGGLSIACKVGGKTVPLGLRLAFYGSVLEPAIPRTEAPTAPSLAYLPSLAIGGLPATPAIFLPGKEGSVDRTYYGADGTVDLTQFGARRILVDFVAGRVYAEELPADERLSLLLKREMNLPVRVRGGDLVLEEIFAKRPQYPALAPYMGARLVRLAGDSAKAWLADLRSSSPEAVRRTGERLARVNVSYSGLIRTADGKDVTLNVDP